MRYLSTRGESPQRSFSQVLLQGLAEDGGLFVPQNTPRAPALERWRGLPFAELFAEVLFPFTAGAYAKETLLALARDAYAGFAHPEVTPLRSLGSLSLCELFHGPTLAFKDVAMQFLSRLLAHLPAGSVAPGLVLGATSGDTGAAAAHAFAAHGTAASAAGQSLPTFIFYPQGRIGVLVERQLLAATSDRVRAIALEGSFDDCQTLVKTLLADAAFRERFRPVAVNSINWARVIAQTPYYFFAYFRLLAAHPSMRCGDPVRFCVPTGNFGHLYAGFIAQAMGLPVERFVLACNANAILHRVVTSGCYGSDAVQRTLSPSMDIQRASNFERLLYDLVDGDVAQVRSWMGALQQKGTFTLSPQAHARLRARIVSVCVDDATTLAAIRHAHAEHGVFLDPHTAVGYHAAQTQPPGAPIILMATAHAAKFATAVRQALGEEPPLPSALASLPEHLPRKSLPVDLSLVKAEIESALESTVASCAG